MRVAFIHTDFRLYWEGRLTALHAFLAERGAELHVVELAGKGSPYAFSEHDGAPPSIPWTCLFPGTRMEDLRPVEACRAIRACLDRLRPDVVFAGALAFPSGIAALRWAKLNRRPIVVFDSVRLEDVPRGRIVSHVKRRLYRHADAGLAPAPGHEEAFLTWGMRPGSVFFGIDAIDNRRFAAIADGARADAEQTRRGLALPDRFLLGVGRLVEKKNWPSLLQAYASFRSKAPDDAPHLILVGDGPERASLQRMATALAIADHVQFRVFAPQDAVACILAMADTLVLPSRYGETWGLVVNEAMACGLPVLVSRQCGCAATLVEPGRNGWTFAPDDVYGLAELLSRVASLPDAERARMGRRSREIIGHWGLPRFCEGAWQAMQFAVAHPLPPPGPVDRLLMALWKGRYRPT